MSDGLEPSDLQLSEISNLCKMEGKMKLLLTCAFVFLFFSVSPLIPSSHRPPDAWTLFLTPHLQVSGSKHHYIV